MPQLSKDEKEIVEKLAQRHAALIYAMTEGNDKLTEMRLSPEAFSELYEKVMADDDGQMTSPGLAHLEEFTVRMKNKVDEFRRGNTPEHAMRMMKAANAGAIMMNSHVRYNYPRLASTISTKKTEIHHRAYKKRWEAMGVLLPDGCVKMGDQVSLNPIGNFRPYDQDPDLFDPSDASRDPAKWKKITFDEFEKADDDLFNNIFFIADPPNGQSFSALELVSLKRTADGIVYEVRWEGTSHAMETTQNELKELAELGLWASSKPPRA